MNSYTRGIVSEYYALLRLMLKGYFPQAIRYKTNVGEIDLVLKRGKMLVFVEVKYRKEYDQGVFAISYQSQRRIRRAAEQYLLANMNESLNVEQNVRFDAVVVSKNMRVKHIENAF